MTATYATSPPVTGDFAFQVNTLDCTGTTILNQPALLTQSYDIASGVASLVADVDVEGIVSDGAAPCDAVELEYFYSKIGSGVSPVSLSVPANVPSFLTLSESAGTFNVNTSDPTDIGFYEFNVRARLVKDSTITWETKVLELDIMGVAVVFDCDSPSFPWDQIEGFPASLNLGDQHKYFIPLAMTLE